MPAIAENEILAEATRKLAAEFSPEEIWLFGSRAWGQPDDDSDYDFLVVVRESAEPSLQRARRVHRVLAGLPAAKDVLVRTRAEIERVAHLAAALETEIRTHGRRIYG